MYYYATPRGPSPAKSSRCFVQVGKMSNEVYPSCPPNAEIRGDILNVVYIVYSGESRGYVGNS